MNKFFQKISIKERAIMAKRLAFLIKADIPLLDSLRLIQKQTKSKSRIKIFDQIIADVSNGQFLSSSMGRFRHAFSDFDVNMIKVGEEAGILDGNLLYLADELEKKHELRKKVTGALVYPIFILFATLGISGLITIYIFPKITPIFKTIKFQLPLSTRILMFVSDSLIKYGFLMGGALLAVLIAGFFLYKKSGQFNNIATHTVLATPLVGRLVKSYYMTNFCRTLGILLKSQFGLLRAIELTSNSTVNKLYKDEVLKIAKTVTSGKKISSHLELKPKLFPEMVPYMVTIGEKTGNLSDTLMYLSNYYEKEVEDITKNLSSSIEPILMVFMGLIVGFVAISVITPIYEITANIHP